MIRITPIDDSKVSDGVWTTYRGVKIKVARAGNDNFTKKFTTLLRPIKEDYENDSADPKMLEEVLCKSLANTILVDWKDFQVSETPVPFNEKNAIELLKNDPDCRAFVQKFSQTLGNFLAAEEEKTKVK